MTTIPYSIGIKAIAAKILGISDNCNGLLHCCSKASPLLRQYNSISAPSLLLHLSPGPAQATPTSGQTNFICGVQRSSNFLPYVRTSLKFDV